jgi:hypothetical protein
LRISFTDHLAAGCVNQINENELSQESRNTIESLKEESVRFLDIRDEGVCCGNVLFKGVQFQKEWLLWPFLTIEVVESDNKTVTSRCMIPLFTCIKEIASLKPETKNRKVKFTLAQFRTLNQLQKDPKFRIGQTVENPATIYHSQMKFQHQNIQVKEFYPDVSLDNAMLNISIDSGQSDLIEEAIQMGKIKIKREQRNDTIQAVRNSVKRRGKCGYLSSTDDEETCVTEKPSFVARMNSRVSAEESTVGDFELTPI